MGEQIGVGVGQGAHGRFINVHHFAGHGVKQGIVPLIGAGKIVGG
ncbi:MAG: hypothetical protein OT477_00605 [Chloroflexi bacterium]|nr:hypothetical protein [Chloroflexota bacterium]